MLGAMQDWPLLVWKIIDHAATYHPNRAIVTNTVEGGVDRSTWRTIHHRSKQLAQALTRLGIGQGDRVATIAWNTHRHVEQWYATMGMGAVAHTINPRLFPDQQVYIANHARDRVLMFDLNLLPLVEKLAPALTTVQHYVLMTGAAHMPSATTLPNLLCYEELIAAEDGSFVWADLDERAPAGLCYTSGTTGLPKGVVYTHRSNMLHALVGSSADALGGAAEDVVLPIVPMFHANGWGVPFNTAMSGSGLVLNGAAFDPATIHRLIVENGVTLTAGVPTVWLGLLQYLRATGQNLGPLKTLLIGGAAAPRSMIDAFEREYGLTVIHSWGMTEMSPMGTICRMTPLTAKLPYEEKLSLKMKQGRPPFGVEMKIVDDNGLELPRDGTTFGRLLVKGPWIIERYEGHDTPAVDSQGWFDTGDVSTLDENGFMQIVDRSKDVIKSGGEWISSIDIENLAVGCPGVAEAAVIGIRHAKWDERPLLVIVRAPGSEVTGDDVLHFLEGKIAKWWMPDAVVFVDSIPHTAAGKIQKTTLREQFADYRLPTAA
jgi:fatty-acyl-CoA synthase